MGVSDDTPMCQRSPINVKPDVPTPLWTQYRSRITIFCCYGLCVIRGVLYYKSLGWWSWMTHWHISSYKGQAALLSACACPAGKPACKCSFTLSTQASWQHIVDTSGKGRGESETSVNSLTQEMILRGCKCECCSWCSLENFFNECTSCNTKTTLLQEHYFCSRFSFQQAEGLIWRQAKWLTWFFSLSDMLIKLSNTSLRKTRILHRQRTTETRSGTLVTVTGAGLLTKPPWQLIDYSLWRQLFKWKKNLSSNRAHLTFSSKSPPPTGMLLSVALMPLMQ